MDVQIERLTKNDGLGLYNTEFLKTHIANLLTLDLNIKQIVQHSKRNQGECNFCIHRTFYFQRFVKSFKIMFQLLGKKWYFCVLSFHELKIKDLLTKASLSCLNLFVYRAYVKSEALLKCHAKIRGFRFSIISDITRIFSLIS